MTTYVLRRLMLYIPTLLGISLAIFLLLRVLPGDIAEIMVLGAGGGDASVNREAQEQAITELRRQLGLDKHVAVQFWDWISSASRGDFGVSFWTKELVRKEIGQRLPLTVELCVLSIMVAIVIAIPVGVLAAVHQNSLLDYALRIFSLAGLSIPAFYAAIMLILFLVVNFRWIPPLGVKMLWENPADNLQQLILPALVLGYELSAITSRMVRSTMLEVLREDFVRTARAKGLADFVVVTRHVLRNAMIPVITIVGLQIAGLLGGSVVIETVFALPGMGTALVGSILHRDYPMVQAIILLFATLVLTVNLLVDVMYAWLDPRIRFG
ncbi:MAG: ABC transporter permease [Chloroflexi bacterium]|nr:ABC transporter permease [Chloroflexota bacterium]